MVLAWLASAASGMLMARYYKQTWKSVKPLGKDFWFRCHQGFMSLAVIMTLIAFFVILAALKGAPFEPEALAKNPHAVIGIVCIILAVIQPIMAYFRPHPGTSNRYYSNSYSSLCYRFDISKTVHYQPCFEQSTTSSNLLLLVFLTGKRLI